MALKAKGRYATSARKATVPKAGPKKRRAKSEEEMIRAAVEEHGKRGVKSRRKASKVNAFQYKDAKVTGGIERQTDDNSLAEWDRIIRSMRTPHGPTPFEAFEASLPEDAKVFAKEYWRMQCKHEREVVESLDPSLVNGTTPITMHCPDCGIVRRWRGNKTETKRHEWMSYCPDGYDMFEWGDLYVTDRSLWQFIHDECQAEMVDDTMKEDA